EVQARELVAEDVMRARTVADIGFLQRIAVDVHLAVDQADAIAGNSHHALHKMLSGMYGIPEDDDVSTLHSLVGHEQIPEAASAIAEFVDQQVVANQQRVFHRLGGNLEGLDDEGDDENCDDHSHQQGLKRTHGVRLAMLLHYFHPGVTTRLNCAWCGHLTPQARCPDIRAL